MGRAPCCDEKLGLKKGPWTPDEDQKLVSYIRQHGHGSWRALPEKAGLKRCGKSCRLRWTNYLRPDIKRGRFSLEEDQLIIQLHAILGNRWSAIASHLPRRTDNEIKNYWNTHLKKRLTRMGIDPITHQNLTTSPEQLPSPNLPPWTPLLSTQLAHMTQWDLTLAEAEARLSLHTNPFLKPFTTPPPMPPPSSLHSDSSAFCIRTWSKTKSEKPKLAPVKLESQFNILHHWAPPLSAGALADTPLGAALSNGCVGTSDDAEIFAPSDRLYGMAEEGWSENIHPGTVIGHVQSRCITESPTSILHGPDSDATSPCGSASSDCFDLVQMHQAGATGLQSFAPVSGPGGVLDSFWQRQQAVMAEALRPDGVLGDGSSVGCISEMQVGPLDFGSAHEFSQFEMLCQGEQYQADCVL